MINPNKPSELYDVDRQYIFCKNPALGGVALFVGIVEIIISVNVII